MSTTPAQADPTATPDQGPDQGPVHTPAKYALFGVVAVIFTVADQASKIWVRGNLAEHRDELQIIPGFLSFIHAENPGAAFSLLRDSEYKGNSSAAQVLEQARAALGEDIGGYRAEFVQLVERWRELGVTAGERR